MLESLAQGGPQRTAVADGCTGRPFQPRADFRMGQLEHQIVRPQAGNIDGGVKPFERVIEIVREKNGLQLALLQHLPGPVVCGHRLGRGVVQGLPVVRRDPIAVEAEKLAGDLQQPAVLNRVLQRRQIGKQPLAFLFGIQARLFDLLFGHAGRVGEFRVVVIAQNIGRRRRRRLEGVDVRVGIDQDDRIQLLKQALSECVGHGVHQPFRERNARRTSRARTLASPPLFRV